MACMGPFNSVVQIGDGLARTGCLCDSGDMIDLYWLTKISADGIVRVTY